MGRRRPSAMRNTLLLGVLVAGLAVLVVGVRYWSQPPVLIMAGSLEEDHRLRQSPDNAYSLVAQVLAELPKVPEGLMAAPAEGVEADNVLMQLLGIRRPKGDAEVEAYLRSCRPALRPLRNVLRMKYYLSAAPGADEDDRAPLPLLSGVLALLAERLLQDPTGSADGIELFAVSGKLASLMGQEYLAWGHARGLERARSGALKRAARSGVAAPVLRDLLARLNEDGPPVPERRVLLEAMWRFNDALVLYPDTVAAKHLEEDLDSLEDRMEVRAHIWMEQKAAAYIVKNRETLYEAVNLRPGEQDEWVRGRIPRFGGHDGIIDPRDQVRFAARLACGLNADHDAARLVLALELHHRQHGAYPATLDALAPGWLEEIPGDECAGTPFVYVLTAAGYRFYGVGPNGIDDGGDPRADVLYDGIEGAVSGDG